MESNCCKILANTANTARARIHLRAAENRKASVNPPTQTSFLSLASEHDHQRGAHQKYRGDDQRYPGTWNASRS